MTYWPIGFAIVQWFVVLPVQVYFVWRSWKNWKQSDKDMLEAHMIQCTLRRALDDFRAWALEQGCDLDQFPPGPTVQ